MKKSDRYLIIYVAVVVLLLFCGSALWLGRHAVRSNPVRQAAPQASSGSAVQKQNTEPFTAITVQGNWQVNVLPADDFQIEAEEALLKENLIRVVQGVLTIGNSADEAGLRELTVRLPLPQTVTLSDGAVMALQNFKLNSLSAMLSNGAQLTAFDSVISSVRLQAQSNSLINLDTATTTATVDASSGASVKLAVSESLKGLVSSGAEILYYGNPVLAIRESSGGHFAAAHNITDE